MLAGGLLLFYNGSVIRNVLKFLTGGLAIVAIASSLLYFTRYLQEFSRGGQEGAQYEKAGQ